MDIGILALGSHHERHGPALPLDTDAKIAEHIAKKVSDRTEATYLGLLRSSYELPEIDTGDHDELDELIEKLKSKIEKAKDKGFEKILILNAHGGNQELEKHISEIEDELNVQLNMDSTVCNIEGPHAGTGEISIGAIIGITDEKKLEEQNKLEKYPEIGFSGLKEVRDKYSWAEKHAQKVEKEGIKVDENLGKKLLQEAIESAEKSIREMRNKN